MAKTITLDAQTFKKWQDDLNAWFQKAQAWLVQYFQNIDTYGMIAVGAIGVGLILFIVGLIII